MGFLKGVTVTLSAYFRGIGDDQSLEGCGMDTVAEKTFSVRHRCMYFFALKGLHVMTGETQTRDGSLEQFFIATLMGVVAYVTHADLEWSVFFPFHESLVHVAIETKIPR